MSVPGVEVQVNIDVLEAIADQARKMPGLMQTAYNRALRPLKRDMLAELKVKPPALGNDDYPLDWETPRQMRAFFATRGFGKGIPTQRTDDLINSYMLEIIFNEQSGGILQLTNDSPHAEYVVGDNAQRMHVAHGWVQYAPVVAKYGEKAEEILIQTWFTVSDFNAGIS